MLLGLALSDFKSLFENDPSLLFQIILSGSSKHNISPGSLSQTKEADNNGSIDGMDSQAWTRIKTAFFCVKFELGF